MNVEPYVRALGMDKAVDFLLAFGGAPMSFSVRPSDRSKVVQLVGVEGCQALAREIGRAARVPVAKRFVAQYLRAVRRMGTHEIARTMRITDDTVRTYLRGERAPSGQLRLL